MRLSREEKLKVLKQRQGDILLDTKNTIDELSSNLKDKCFWFATGNTQTLVENVKRLDQLKDKIKKVSKCN